MSGKEIACKGSKRANVKENHDRQKIHIFFLGPMVVRCGGATWHIECTPKCVNTKIVRFVPSNQL